MASDEFRRGVDDDVGSVFDRTDQIGSSEGIVDHQRKPVLVSDLRDRVDVGNVAVRVAEGLQIHSPCLICDGAFELRQVVRVHESRLDAVLGKCVAKKVEASAVNSLLRDDVAAACGQGLNCIGNGRRAGSYCQGSGAAFKSSETLLEHLLGGIGQTAVDVAGIGESEAVRRVFAVVEHIGSGLVDRNGAGIGCRIGLFLSNVQLQGLKLVITHFISPFLVLYDLTVASGRSRDNKIPGIFLKAPGQMASECACSTNIALS